MCGKSHWAEGTQQQHSTACAYAYKNPEIDDEKSSRLFAQTGRLRIILDARSYVFTTGLNTCFFVVVQTEGATLAWHAKHDPSALSQLRKEFKKVGSTYGRFIRGFIIPGVDRDDNLNLKPTSRTMRELGAFLDPAASKNFLMGFLAEFDWAKQLVTVAPPRHYKDFVFVDPNHDLPFAFSDVARFDTGCTFDGEVDPAQLSRRPLR